MVSWVALAPSMVNLITRISTNMSEFSGMAKSVFIKKMTDTWFGFATITTHFKARISVLI